MTASEPDNRICASCGIAIDEPYAHCGICAADYCLPCGARHVCGVTCLINGCIPGKCVKVIRNGEPSPKWGVPRELLESKLNPP